MEDQHYSSFPSEILVLICLSHPHGTRHGCAATYCVMVTIFHVLSVVYFDTFRCLRNGKTDICSRSASFPYSPISTAVAPLVAAQFPHLEHQHAPMASEGFQKL